MNRKKALLRKKKRLAENISARIGSSWPASVSDEENIAKTALLMTSLKR